VSSGLSLPFGRTAVLAMDCQQFIVSQYTGDHETSLARAAAVLRARADWYFPSRGEVVTADACVQALAEA
jgi:hypothetical protein